MVSSLEEVIGGSSGDVRFTAARSRIELKEGVFQRVVQFHDGRLISAAITIVGGGENRHHVPVVAPVVSFHDELVSSGHQGQAVGVVEGLRNILSESVSGSSGRDAPATAIIGIGPEQVAHRALMGDLL